MDRAEEHKAKSAMARKATQGGPSPHQRRLGRVETCCVVLCCIVFDHLTHFPARREIKIKIKTKMRAGAKVP